MTSASAVNYLGSDPARTCAQYMCLCDGGNSAHKHCSTKCLVHLCPVSSTLINQSITILHLETFLWLHKSLDYTNLHTHTHVYLSLLYYRLRLLTVNSPRPSIFLHSHVGSYWELTVLELSSERYMKFWNEVSNGGESLDSLTHV